MYFWFNGINLNSNLQISIKFIFKNCIEVTIDSHTIDSHSCKKIKQKRSLIHFISFSPMEMFCKTIVYYHNQDTNIDTIYQSYSDVSSSTCIRLCIYFCVYLALWNISHLYVLISLYSRYSTVPTPQISFYSPFINTSTVSSSTTK